MNTISKVTLTTALLCSIASPALATDLGACCVPNDDYGYLCQILNEANCHELGGYFYGVGSNCSDPFVECITLDGACCYMLPDGSQICDDIEEGMCEELAGTWFGVGTDCNDPDIVCGEVDGACCWEDVSGWQCLEVEDYKCEDLGGTWYGAGVDCTDPAVDCDPEPVEGACCADADYDGQYWCVILTQADCFAANGFWYGPGSACSDPFIECETATVLCDLEPGAMCAGRPNYADAGFQSSFSNGDIAVQTASPAITGGFVLTVFDLGDSVGAPTDSTFLIDRYSHASWTQNTLGSIFGLTVDGDGAIYVSASKSWWMDVQGPAGWGGVYRVDPVTSAVTTFAQLPNSGSSLGSITFDCGHDQFFVTNFEDGKVYRLDMSGNTLDAYDHGVAFNGNGPASLGDRPFAVEVHNGRLYYSMWNEDQGSPSSAMANEVWSVELDFAGAPMASTAVLEIELPTYYTQSWSSPVSDIRFTGEGTMLLAERTCNGIDGVGAHDARLFEYECQDGGWVQMPKSFIVGIIPESSAGGVDYTSDRYWVSADAMHLGVPDTMYGMQGLPIAGGSTVDSLLVDYQGNLTNTDKTLLGDLVIIPEGTAVVVCPELWDLSVDCLSGNPPFDYAITLGVSNWDPNGTITHIDLAIAGPATLTPSSFNMNLPPQHGWSIDTLLDGAANGQEICIDALVTFNSGQVCETTFCIDLPDCNTLPGDINFDGVVNVDDLMILLGSYGVDCPDGCPGDIDGDGEVNVDDLMILLSAFGSAR